MHGVLGRPHSAQPRSNTYRPALGETSRLRCAIIVHAQTRRESMTDMLTTAVLFERVDAMEAQELDRLQAAIERRRRQLAGDEVVPSAGPSSTVVERRAYGSGVLQLEKRGESGPYWYFHHRKDGKQKTFYLNETATTEITLAHLKGGIGG